MVVKNSSGCGSGGENKLIRDPRLASSASPPLMAQSIRYVFLCAAAWSFPVRSERKRTVCFSCSALASAPVLIGSGPKRPALVPPLYLQIVVQLIVHRASSLRGSIMGPIPLHGGASGWLC